MHLTDLLGRTPIASWVAAALLGLFPSFVGWLAPSDLGYGDEAKVALYVLSVLDGEQWLPRSRGEPATKPPLYAWTAAPLAGLFGANEVTVRLPSVLSAIALALLTFAIGRRLYDEKTALLGVVLLVSAQPAAKLAYFARYDMMLSVWVALAMWSYLSGRWRLFFVACGLGMLTKGPIGPAIPLVAVSIEAGVCRSWEPLRRLRPGRGLLVFLAVVGVWAVPVAIWHFQDVWDVMVRSEFIDRLGGSGSRAAKDRDPFWQVVPYFFQRLLPWSLLVPAAFWLTIRSRATRVLGSWVLAGLLLTAIPASKRADYLMPLYPAACLLTAGLLIGWLRGEIAGRLKRALSAGMWGWALLGASAAASAPLVVWLARGTLPPVWTWGVSLAAGCVFGWALRPGASDQTRLAQAVAAQFLAVWMSQQFLSSAAKTPEAPLLADFASEVRGITDEEPVEFHDAHAEVLNFLLRRNVADLSVDDLRERASERRPTWLVTSSRFADQLRGDPLLAAEVGGMRLVAASEPRDRRRGERAVLVRLAEPEDSQSDATQVAPGRVRRPEGAWGDGSQTASD